MSEYKLVVYHAPWCGPCKAYAPIVEEFAKNNIDCVVGRIDVDEFPEEAISNNIKRVPASIFYKNGEEIFRFSGGRGLGDLQIIYEEQKAK